MKNLMLLIICLSALQHVMSQKTGNGSIKGALADTSGKELLADATVSLLTITDSSVVAYTRAKEKGAFQIKNIDFGTYRLVISFQGYHPFNKRITVSATAPEVDLGIIYMQKTNDMLEEIIVERPPIIIKGDTVEFSASAFKTKPNAVAEDLLKKLPGVEVDKDGNITAQGEAIQKVYVNGKEFFGSDPKMATKNITADMIESVQVFDDMSEQAKFTRIDDGSRSKTINIKLKKGMETGYFGRGNIGYGTKDRYSGSLMMNMFQGERRISVIGSSNNVNRQSFLSRDIVGGMGGFSGVTVVGSRGGSLGGRVGGGPPRGGNVMIAGGFNGANTGGGNNGLTRATNGGFNYSDNFGKLSFTGSYMFGNTRNQTYQTSYNETRIPVKDSVSYETDTSSSVTNNTNHNFNLRLEYTIDSMNSIVFTPNFVIQNSADSREGSNFIRGVTPGLDYLSLSGISQGSNKRNGISLNNELLFRHRFKEFGRTFTIGYKNTINNSNGSGSTYSPLSFYAPSGTLDSVRQQDFLSSQLTRSNNNVISSSYTEPLGNNKLLEVNYAYTNNSSTSDRDAFSYNTNTGRYDSVNAQQTNYFKNMFVAHRFGLNFRYKTSLYGFQAGGAVQASRQDNSSVQGIYSVNGKDSVIRTTQNFLNFFPTASFNYDFSRRKNIQIRYQGRTNQPTIKQLQDVRDETDVLQTVVGNPGLRQEFSNQINASYKTFNEITYRYLNVNIIYSQTSNKIVNSISFDTLRGSGVQLIKPVNLNGAYNASYDISLGIPLQSTMKGSSINFSNTMKYNRDVSRQYGQNSYTKTFTISQSAAINLDVKEKLNMEFKGRFSYNSATYSAQQKNTNNTNTRYFTQNYSTNVNYFITPSLILSTDFDYAINTGRAEGYNQSIPLWNAGLAYQIFRKKNGEIKLSVNDILNQNQSIDRQIGENYISDTRTVVLQRYFLLTFTYSFNRFGKNGQAPGIREPRRMPPVMWKMNGERGGMERE